MYYEDLQMIEKPFLAKSSSIKFRNFGHKQGIQLHKRNPWLNQDANLYVVHSEKRKKEKKKFLHKFSLLPAGFFCLISKRRIIRIHCSFLLKYEEYFLLIKNKDGQIQPASNVPSFLFCRLLRKLKGIDRRAPPGMEPEEQV